MLKLEAILVARTAARPWRSGWSADRGIDFIASDPGRRIIVAASNGSARVVAAESPCFLDEDDVLPDGTSVVRRHVSLAAQAAAAAARESTEAPLTRAWSSLARKLPGS